MLGDLLKNTVNIDDALALTACSAIGSMIRNFYSLDRSVSVMFGTETGNNIMTAAARSPFTVFILPIIRFRNENQSVASFVIPERMPFTALPPSDSLFGTFPPSIKVPGTVGVIRTFPVPR